MLIKSYIPKLIVGFHLHCLFWSFFCNTPRWIHSMWLVELCQLYWILSLCLLYQIFHAFWTENLTLSSSPLLPSSSLLFITSVLVVLVVSTISRSLWVILLVFQLYSVTNKTPNSNNTNMHHFAHEYCHPKMIVEFKEDKLLFLAFSTDVERVNFAHHKWLIDVGSNLLVGTYLFDFLWRVGKKMKEPFQWAKIFCVKNHTVQKPPILCQSSWNFHLWKSVGHYTSC